MTGRSGEQTLLVCVYYRVAPADAERAISAVREFQRTLHFGVRVLDVEVLLRCGLPPVAASPAPLADPSHRKSPDPVPASIPLQSPAPSVSPEPDDATLMETYRVALPDPAGSAAAQAAVRQFLDGLDAAASAITPLLRGPRHVELFASCVS